MYVRINPDDVIEATTDSRGRVYLGSEYADSEVEIAVLDEPKPKDE